MSRDDFFRRHPQMQELVKFDSRRPVLPPLNAQKSWVFQHARNPRENLFDKYSIYNMKPVTYRPNYHGNVTAAKARTQYDISFKEEKKYIKKVTGAKTPHITGSAHPKQHRVYHYRPKTRQKSALTEKVNWYHNGTHGKTILTTKKYPYLLRNSKCPHVTDCVGQFCEVLGPKSCTACTEMCNKKLVAELHSEVFPYTEMTTASLVAPFLANKLLGRNYCECRICTKHTPTETPFETDPIQLIKNLPRLKRERGVKRSSIMRSRMSEATGISGRTTRTTMTVIRE